jgi:hypothetical protein
MPSAERQPETHVRAALTMLIGIAALAPCMPNVARAEIEQRVIVVHETPTGIETDDGDEVRVPPDALRTVSASIVGSGFSAAGSIGVFGNLGVEGAMFRTGRLLTQASVSNDEFVNPLSTPQHAQANFIVDGGSLVMLAGPASHLSFQLSLTARILTAAGTDHHSESFVSNIELEQLVTGLDFQTFGPSLGATYDGAFRVDIPLSLQTLDLGLIPGGGSIDFDYLLTIEAETVGFTEIAAWRFSDPVQVDGLGEFPTVLFADAAAVPEPSGLVPLAIAALGLLGFGVRRPYSAACASR